jgi:hypothetical protein
MPWAEWIDYTETSVSQTSEPPTEQVKFIKQMEDIIADQKTPAIPLSALQEIIDKSHTASVEETKVVAAALDLPVDSDSIRTRLSLTSIPPAGVYAPSLTPLSTSSLWVQMPPKWLLHWRLRSTKGNANCPSLQRVRKHSKNGTPTSRSSLISNKHIKSYTSLLQEKGPYIDGVESRVNEAKASGNLYLTKKLEEQLARSKERNLKLAALQSPHSSPAVVPQRYYPLST